jgi:hypothetical protein
LVTAITGTVSAAPDAALATVAFTPTARSFGTMTAHCAEGVGAAHAGAEVVGIRHAIEDQQEGGSAGASRTSSSVTCGKASSTTATTP